MYLEKLHSTAEPLLSDPLPIIQAISTQLVFQEINDLLVGGRQDLWASSQVSWELSCPWVLTCHAGEHSGAGRVLALLDSAPPGQVVLLRRGRGFH